MHRSSSCRQQQQQEQQQQQQQTAVGASVLPPLLLLLPLPLGAQISCMQEGFLPLGRSVHLLLLNNLQQQPQV
jgi:hypothetical protein